MNHEALSERGIERRQQILLLAKAEARRRRQRRSILRSGGFLAGVAVLGGAFWLLALQQPASLPRSVPVLAVKTAPPPPTSLVEYVQTDPTITDRLSIKPEPPRWTSIGDTELLQELASAGQPVGIVCMNGKTFLLPR